MRIVVLGGYILLSLMSTAYAQVPDQVAARVIIGEAADQGLKGMICVAEVLRHRGSTKGFYGYSWNEVTHQPGSIWSLAEKAWEISQYTN